MEFFLIILLVIILIVMLGFRKDTSAKLQMLDEKVESLKAELKLARAKAQEFKAGEASIVKSPVPPKPDVVQPVAAIVSPPAITSTPLPEKDLVSQESRKPVVVVGPKIIEPVVTRPKVNVPPKPARPGFFERNPDLEKFIGENLANKIGIGVLVLGIGFFVKYAIDQEWIGEIGRVFIGILCGGILLGVAHWLRKAFTAFSSVLVGGGIAVLYLTIAIAFHEYHIFSQTAAFILMVVITGFAVVFSLAYNRIELAVLSILGGFGSPFMVSTGQGNYVALFTYILVLDLGMLVLAYYKKWNLVNIISYAFTIILFGFWLFNFDQANVSMIRGSMIFATLFYLVFFGMNIINNIKERTSFKSPEIGILLSNTFFYYGAGITILNNPIGTDFKGLFTAALGVFNFIFAFLLYKNSRVDKTLVFMLIGLVLTFISLAAPVQLEGNYITLFWAAETVLVLWLSQKSGIRLMKLASLILMGLMVVSLLMDWTQIYFEHQAQRLNIILNKGYITSLFAIASVVATLLLLRNEKRENPDDVKVYRIILLCGGVIIFYFAHLLELRHQLFEHAFDYGTQNVIIGAYNMLCILALLLAQEKWIKHKLVHFVFTFWGGIVMLAYVAFYHAQNIQVRNAFLLSNASPLGFVFHYLLLALVVAVAVITLRRIRKETAFNLETYNAYSWIYVAFFVFVASAELDHLVVTVMGATTENIEHILSQNHKIGFPILWGLASFLLIFVGLKRKQKHVRVVSLSLFLLTLLKLFIVDIRGISEGGKIAAFISLGILLLVVSFMYQRLKKLLLADESSQPKENV